MVSSTLCPAVHILGSQNVYGRAEGIADHYWPWAVFFPCSNDRSNDRRSATDLFLIVLVDLLLTLTHFHARTLLPSIALTDKGSIGPFIRGWLRSESAMEVNRGEQIDFKLQCVSVIFLAFHLCRSERQHIRLHRNTNA